MKNPDQYLDPYNPEESEEIEDNSQREPSIDSTIPHPISQSETSSPLLKSEKEDSLSRLLQTPLSSTPIESIRGQTIAKWSIDRRRTAKHLLDIWNKASQGIDDSACVVYVDHLITEIDRYAPGFRDIPYEDAFSGILQLVRDALIGENFSQIQNNRLENIIDQIFKIIVTKEKLDMLEYKKIHKMLADNHLLRK
jgi:hypothetical protein